MKFYLADFANGSLFEPGKLSVGQKQLFIPDENPKAIMRNICHINAESADAMRCVCHGAASLSGKGLRCTSPLQSIECHPFFQRLSFSIMKALNHAVDTSEICIVDHILRLLEYLYLAR